MKRAVLIVFGILSWGLSACSQKKISSIKSKSEYIAFIKGLSEKKSARQLEEDAYYIHSVLDSVEGFQFYFMFGIGPDSDGGEQRAPDTAQAFTLPPRDSIYRDLFHPERSMYFNQELALPQSAFEFTAGFEDEGFLTIRPNKIDYAIREIYLDGRPVKVADLKLQQADSIALKATYRFPVSYDTLVIDIRDKDSIIYNGYTIKLDKLSERKLIFSIPVALSVSVLGHNGLTEEGVLIGSNSYSSFPVTGIDAQLIQELQSLEKALKSKNKDKVFGVLEKSSDSILVNIEKLAKLHKAYLDYENDDFEDDFDEIKVMKDWMKRYADVLGVNEIQYEMSFPNDAAKVYLYVGREYDSLSRAFVAQNNRGAASGFSVYHDKEKRKYGIANKKGDVVIPAEYANLEYSGGNYFIEIKEDGKNTFHLDSDDRTLTKIPGELSFLKELNDGLTAFTDESYYVGVLDAHQNEVIPFRYDGIGLEGGLLVATASLRGRKYFEFFMLDGEQIELPERIVDYGAGKGYVILETRDQRQGVINSAEGKIALPLQYHLEGRLSDRLWSFCNAEKVEKSPLGIVDVLTGQIVLPPDKGYDDIGVFFNGLAVVDVQPGYGRRLGYIDQSGKLKIDPHFLYATDFYKGYAAVRATDEKAYLINSNGQVVRSFPDIQPREDYVRSNYVQQRQSGDLIFYDINESYYDYMGAPLSKSDIESLEE